MPLTTIAGLLTLLTREPGRPRITWYGDGGERVELSGAVLENWVNKTANLLVEELDAGPGTRVRLDLPGHWRTVVWALSTWRTGACAVLDPTEPTADVVVTDRANAPSAPGSVLVLVSLPALARRFDGVAPPGSVDAATAVMTYADALGWVPPLDPGAPALAVADETVPHADLLLGHAPGTAGRSLVAVDAAGSRGLLSAALDAFVGDGSVVVVSPGVGAELRADPDRRRRLVDSERITADHLG